MDTLGHVLLTFHSKFILPIFGSFRSESNVLFLTGDCCSGDSDYNYCSDCSCKYDEYELYTGKLENLDSDRCQIYAHVIGDGFCHDETNTEECAYDGGDCCNPITLINSCEQCSCLQPNKSGATIVQQHAACPSQLDGYLNNGHCDDIVSK